MKPTSLKGILFLPLIPLLQACTGSTPNLECQLGAGGAVSISGRISFDRVPLNSSGSLDFSATSAQPARMISVQAMCGSKVVASVSTDDNGYYTISLPANSRNLFLRARSEMFQDASPGWDVKVVNNDGSSPLLYALDSSIFNIESSPLVRNLHAASGWSGTAYSTTRAAAPFAILDTIYDAMQVVLSVSPAETFPALQVNWSPEQTVGTNYRDNVINVLGTTTDTDEFDRHVIAHEWGHYYQDVFSRDESIGGPHSLSSILDIRVAFSEGFGNAFSAIVTEDTVYKDSQNINLSTGFTINIESNSCFNEGWYNECSVQSVLYDLFDTVNEGNDVFSFGFAPLHNVLTGGLKTSDGLTSLFSFVDAFKTAQPAAATDLDTLLADQDISTISDAFGTGISQPATYAGLTSSTPVYDSGFPVTLCTTGENGGYNGYGVSRFARFTATSTSSFTFTANKNGGEANVTDPDLYIREKDVLIASGVSFNTDTETVTAAMENGKTYTLELREFRVYSDPDYNPLSGSFENETCFTVTQS